jgi:hypothetical protein
VSDQTFRPVRGIGTAAIILIGLTAAGSVVSTVMDWVTAPVIEDYLAGGDTTAEEAFAASASALAVMWVSLVAYVVAGIVFMIWMYWARLNSHAVTGTHQHRWAPMWAIIGWFIPFVNLVVPHSVMQDVWRGSDRSQQLVRLSNRPKINLIKAWWACWIVSGATGVLSARMPQDVVVWSTISAAASVAAAVLIARVIRQLSEVQHALNEQTASHAPGA